MSKPFPIAYSPVDEAGFSFHIRNHLEKVGRNISMNRIARLWWIARNSPYISGAYKELKINELTLIKKANALTISDRVLKEDLEILRSAGILIDVITSDKQLLFSQFKKQYAEILEGIK